MSYGNVLTKYYKNDLMKIQIESLFESGLLSLNPNNEIIFGAIKESLDLTVRSILKNAASELSNQMDYSVNIEAVEECKIAKFIKMEKNVKMSVLVKKFSNIHDLKKRINSLQDKDLLVINGDIVSYVI